eukprot:g19325.t1
MEKAGSRGGSAVRRESPSPDPGDSEEEEEEEQVSDKPCPRTTEIAPRRVRVCRPEGTGGSVGEGMLRGRSSGAERESRTEGVSSESDSMGDSDRGSGGPRNGKGPRPAPSQGQKRREDSEEEGEEEDSDSQTLASGEDEGQRAGAKSSADESSG